jgi:hypothetical protein
LLARVAFEELLERCDRFQPDFATGVRVRTPNFRGWLRLQVEVA